MKTKTTDRKLGPAALNLPDIDDVKPLSKEDRACFNEIRGVLSKHGKLDRFGLSLLHKHFDIFEGERLVEYCDETNRTLTLKVVKNDDLPVANVVETNWRLDLNVSTKECVPTTVCLTVNGYHPGPKTIHQKVKK